MHIEQFSLTSSDGKQVLDGLLLLPADRCRGLVQISHGMAEYKERYRPFMEYLTTRGWGVAIHDHRGHGKSVVSSDDWGYFGDEEGQAIVRDLCRVSDYLKNRFPTLPLFYSSS